MPRRAHFNDQNVKLFISFQINKGKSKGGGGVSS